MRNLVATTEDYKKILLCFDVFIIVSLMNILANSGLF